MSLDEVIARYEAAVERPFGGFWDQSREWIHERATAIAWRAVTIGRPPDQDDATWDAAVERVLAHLQVVPRGEQCEIILAEPLRVDEFRSANNPLNDPAGEITLAEIEEWVAAGGEEGKILDERDEGMTTEQIARRVAGAIRNRKISDETLARLLTYLGDGRAPRLALAAVLEAWKTDLLPALAERFAKWMVARLRP